MDVGEFSMAEFIVAWVISIQVHSEEGISFHITLFL